jgi:uncharacterized protein (TIGR02453 family)
VPDRKYFTRNTFRFMAELAQNNDREWFAENKHRYEADIKDASLGFIENFAAHLEKLSPHFMATPRSLFRIYRDVRFSKDNRPYKTHAGIHFRHEQSKDAHAPGYYLHLEPGSVFAGMGIWHPDSKALRAIREHIVAEPAAWRRVSRSKKFGDSMELEGNRLTRPPKGFDPEHPLIEDLKWKDFVGVKHLSQSFATSADLPKQLAKIFKAGTPFMTFLCDALGVPF